MLSPSNNTQYLDTISQIKFYFTVKGKQKDLEKLLSYFNGIVTSVFKIGIAGCGGRGGRDPSGFCGGCAGRGGRAGVFSVIFILY